MVCSLKREFTEHHSAAESPLVTVLPRLQKGKLLRAWMNFLQDQSLEIHRKDRYGRSQLGVLKTRANVGEISALTFLSAALHPAMFADDLAKVGLGQRQPQSVPAVMIQNRKDGF